MRTKLFEWAEKQNLDLEYLAKKIGYSERHLKRIRDEGFPVTEEFQARVVLRMGDWARALFLPEVSPCGDIPSETRDGAQEADDAAA